MQGDILVTKLMRDGVEVGLANYLTYERIFAWTIPGMTEGLINNDHLKTRYAGWPFTPGYGVDESADDRAVPLENGDQREGFRGAV